MQIPPRSLFGRLVLLLLAGLILAQSLSVFILLRDRGQLLYESIQENLIVRTRRHCAPARLPCRRRAPKMLPCWRARI